MSYLSMTNARQSSLLMRSNGDMHIVSAFKRLNARKT